MTHWLHHERHWSPVREEWQEPQCVQAWLAHVYSLQYDAQLRREAGR